MCHCVPSGCQRRKGGDDGGYYHTIGEFEASAFHIGHTSLSCVLVFLLFLPTRRLPTHLSIWSLATPSTWARTRAETSCFRKACSPSSKSLIPCETACNHCPSQTAQALTQAAAVTISSFTSLTSAKVSKKSSESWWSSWIFVVAVLLDFGCFWG